MTPAASRPSASQAGEQMELPPSLIDRDLALWPRQGELDASRVELFADLLAEQPDTLPPVLVVASGNRYILADGWHRLAAYDSLPADVLVPALVVESGDRDPRDLAYESAIAEAVRSAKPLTSDERRAAVQRLAQERGDLNQADIARLVGISQATVSRWVAAQRCEAGQREAPASAAPEDGASTGQHYTYAPPDEDGWALSLRGLRLLRRAYDADGHIAERAVTDFLDQADDKRRALRCLHAYATAMLKAVQAALEPPNA